MTRTDALMTSKQFLKTLARYAHLAKWVIEPSGVLRAHMGRRRYCPVTFVCMAVLKRHYHNDLHWQAARTLRLPEKIATVMAASGDNGFPGNQQTRDRLFVAVGLMEARGQ